MYHSVYLKKKKKYKSVKDEKIWKICKYTYRDNKQKKIKNIYIYLQIKHVFKIYKYIAFGLSAYAFVI